MAKPESYAALVAAIDVETTRIASKIEELLAKITAGGMSAADEDAAGVAIAAQLDKLKALGQDPAQPIPPDEPPA